jgi:hypothetical protein
MNRLRLMLLTAFLAGVFSGCSEGQPNAPAEPSETGPEFAKKTAEMMKAANSGMDLKKVNAGAAAPKQK